ncbi:MAG: hypothetical protein ACK4ZM_01690, partial [bacterium]
MEGGQLIQTIAEKVKEIITAEVKQELRDFKNTVSGQLEGFKLAIEGVKLAIENVTERQNSLESEVRNINQKIEKMFM